MKKLGFLFLFISGIAFAQKNEIKFNALKILDLSYERKLGNHFSSGIHLGTGLFTYSDVKNKLFVKMFGRYYPLNKQDFNKLFLQLSFIQNNDEYFPSTDPNVTHRVGPYNESAITVGVGYKFLIIKKLSIEVYADIGPELNHPDSLLPILGDAGLNFGYRF